MSMKAKTYKVSMNGKVKCPQCFGDLILTKATDHGEEYYYCRACKKELDEMKLMSVAIDQQNVPWSLGDTEVDLTLTCDGISVKKIFDALE